MLTWTHPFVVRTSPALLGTPARGGLTTRLGFPAADGDDPTASRQVSRAALARSLGCGVEQLVWLHQVHGADVAVATRGGCLGEGDALVTTRGDLVPLISVADCCPVLLWQPDGPARGVAHAGWRGVVAGVLEATVRAMAALGADPSRLRVWIGPSIGPCCFEVGPEVAARFGASCVRPGDPRPHADLRAASVQALVGAGIDGTAVEVVDDCTSCRRDLYWSYRRDGKIAGRHLAYIRG